MLRCGISAVAMTALLGTAAPAFAAAPQGRPEPVPPAAPASVVPPTAEPDGSVPLATAVPEADAGSPAPATVDPGAGPERLPDAPAERAIAEEGPIPDPCEDARTRTPSWSRELWIDRFEKQLRASGCRSALWIDRLFGPPEDLGEYREVSGNVATSLLWSEYDGFDPRVRFRVNLPLPRTNERVRAFIGRTDRDEFVTERGETIGFVPRQFGTIGEEQTLLGLGYRPPSADDGSGFDFSTGVRARFPLDPFVKTSYRMAWFDGERSAVLFKPTVFWQQSEQFGLTTRIDVPHVFTPDWLALLTASATWSERSQGARGYVNATVFRTLGRHGAAALQVGAEGEADAEVPVREWGVRALWRRNVWRDWLALELRTSLTWPRERRDEPREPSWGAGVGFELVFGEGSFRGM